MTSTQSTPEPTAPHPEPQFHHERWEKAQARAIAWSRTYLMPFLRCRATELENALQLGWNFTPLWLRALTVLASLFLFTLIFGSLGSDVVDVYYRLVGHTHTGLLATISHPIRSYLNAHRGELHLSVRNLFGLWELTAIALIIAGFFGSTLARLGWLAFGTATAAMVWSATPDPARPVATAIAAGLWGIASLLALRGLNLRLVQINIDARSQQLQPPTVPNTTA
ncbi:hypothetical protein [Streptacidiphilus anmyonensis]|uniref:hypothetical protein n=1 Tax=Streptacidiphilus anmyonensis TaxID=405782 RepID=UPI0006938357|nr:hypothetical protein [Streptacidiphilus anmyonensis]